MTASVVTRVVVPADLRAAIVAQHGFLTAANVAALAAAPGTRGTPVLVRCGGCRFTTPASDVGHLAELIRAGDHDYVRDYSLPYGVVLVAEEGVRS